MRMPSPILVDCACVLHRTLILCTAKGRSPQTFIALLGRFLPRLGPPRKCAALFSGLAPFHVSVGRPEAYSAASRQSSSHPLQRAKQSAIALAIACSTAAK